MHKNIFIFSTIAIALIAPLNLFADPSNNEVRVCFKNYGKDVATVKLAKSEEALVNHFRDALSKYNKLLKVTDKIKVKIESGSVNAKHQQSASSAANSAFLNRLNSGKGLRYGSYSPWPSKLLPASNNTVVSFEVSPNKMHCASTRPLDVKALETLTYAVMLPDDSEEGVSLLEIHKVGQATVHNPGDEKRVPIEIK